MNTAIELGHTDKGGATGIIKERDVIIKTAQYLVPMLKERGHTTTVFDFARMSNTEDLKATVRGINARKFDIVLSLHADWAENPSARGASCLFLSARGKKLAECIAAHIVPVMPGRAAPVVYRDNLYILKHTKPVACLIELLFVTSPEDVDKFRRESKGIARAISAGVDDYAKIK